MGLEASPYSSANLVQAVWGPLLRRYTGNDGVLFVVLNDGLDNLKVPVAKDRNLQYNIPEQFRARDIFPTETSIRQDGESPVNTAYAIL